MTVGLVRYQEEPADPYNTIRFLFTKRAYFENEKELRVVLQCGDPFGKLNRHLDPNNVPSREPRDEFNRLNEWVHPSKRRRIDLKSVVTEIRMSPWATPKATDEVRLWVANKNLSCPVN